MSYGRPFSVVGVVVQFVAKLCLCRGPAGRRLAGSGRAPFRVRARYLPIDAFLEGFEISEQTEI